MNIAQSVFLGVLQGFTEFLPISSSGHLVLAQSWFPNFNQPGVLFDVVLHAGTLLSVLVYFRKILVKFFGNYFMQIVIGTIPVVVVGVIFQGAIEDMFKSVQVVAIAFLVTSLMNFLTNKAKTKKTKISFADSLFVGFAQAFAIIPGISRSGATIFSATARKVESKTAAEFSFLLSVPAVLGANLLQLFKNGIFDEISATFYFTGFLTSFLSGLVAINLLFSLLKEKKFGFFSLYCFILGALALAS